MIDDYSTDIDSFEAEVSSARRSQSLIMNQHISVFFVIFAVAVCLLAIPRSAWLIPTKKTDQKILVKNEPIQIDIPENISATDLTKASDFKKLVQLKNIDKKVDYYILPLAKYSLSGRLIEKNKFFPYDFGDFDKIARVDLGIVWGDLANDDTFKKLNAHSQQTGNSRRLLIYYKDQYKDEYAKNYAYVDTHGSHTHVIPANKNIMKALDSLRRGESVKIEGYLVDVYNSQKQRIAMSSLSRADHDETSRGNGKGGGACEIMYVARVQIGNKVFE